MQTSTISKIESGTIDLPNIAILDVLSRALLHYLRKRGRTEDDEALFESSAEGDGHFVQAGLRANIRRMSQRAGVKPPSLHSFRRAFALMSLRNGADVYSLQRLMGHAGLTVLRRYLAQTEEDLQTVHARSSPVDGRKL